MNILTKIIKVIDSCENISQLNIARKYYLLAIEDHVRNKKLGELKRLLYKHKILSEISDYYQEKQQQLVDREKENDYRSCDDISNRLNSRIIIPPCFTSAHSEKGD